MLSALLLAALPALAVAEADHLSPNFASRSAHSRNAVRLVREEAEARSVAENRNWVRLNYTMKDWEDIYGPSGTEHLEPGELHEHAKRGSYHGRATFYSPGANACGGGPEGYSDNIVALNVHMYGGNGNIVSPYCFKKVIISYGSKTEEAQIVDCCMGCGDGDLDMSPGLFSKFADQSMGIFYMSWYFEGSGGSSGGSSGSSGGSGSGGGDSSPSHNSPQPTPSTSSHASSTSSAHSSVASNATATQQQSGLLGTANWKLAGGNLDNVNQVVLGLGNLVAQVAVQASASADH